jgi:hypothetical protein
MHVELGPVPSGAALAWLNYARETLGVVRADPRDTPPGVLETMARFLEEWTAAARAAPTFRWEGEVSAEHVAYLVEWLYRLGVRVQDDAESGRARLRPPEADKFHVLLVRTVLDTLAREEPSQAHFVDELRARWKIARPEHGA